MKYLYNGFDGNEFDASDPAFRKRFMDELFETIKKWVR